MCRVVIVLLLAVCSQFAIVKSEQIERQVTELERIEQELRKQTALLKKLISDKNLASGKTCGSSSRFEHFIPESAVDGYLTTMFHSNFERNPLWWVDLGRIYSIHRVVIYNRIDCCGDRLHNLQVTVGPNLHSMRSCDYFQGLGIDGQHISLSCPRNMTGAYVKIRITGEHSNFLQLAEVEIYGSL